MSFLIAALMLVIGASAPHPSMMQPVHIPLRNENGVLLVSATVDNAGPLLFVLDPGEKDLYTTYARGRLNGSAPRTVCLAEACYTAGMEYFAGDGSALDPRHDSAAGSIAGSIGPELLRHYVAQIDYAASTLTLIDPQQFHPPAGSSIFPLRFDAFSLPLIPAIVDGISGDFELDVRAPTSMLFTHFLEQTTLRRTYARAPIAKHSPTLAAYAVKSVQVAGVTQRGVPFWFATKTKGKFAGGAVAGLLGNNVLSKFVVTIDEPHQRMYLNPQPYPEKAAR